MKHSSFSGELSIEDVLQGCAEFEVSKRQPWKKKRDTPDLELLFGKWKPSS